jgi:hypothetical protein
MNRLHRETSSTLAAGSLVATAMMHERGIHEETVCPDLAIFAIAARMTAGLWPSELLFPWSASEQT